jgi:hypothetical protein
VILFWLPCAATGLAVLGYIVANRHTVLHFTRRGEAPFKLARCVCGEKIVPCDHVGGVRSTWEHLKTGDHFCADGVSEARHR